MIQTGHGLILRRMACLLLLSSGKCVQGCVDAAIFTQNQHQGGLLALLKRADGPRVLAKPQLLVMGVIAAFFGMFFRLGGLRRLFVTVVQHCRARGWVDHRVRL